jgi:aspartyl-tRNA(Asn)/glutamyl-tRNA(Gln) amidotransferase subunit B
VGIGFRVGRFLTLCKQGSLRCDVNVSVNKKDLMLGTRCEIKNLNSVKGAQVAIG